ncbi:MAG TPA: hypothetical protein VHX92_04650 [Rhizomicrobium sp.]|nr:hypothetical protein [Rhizomicrobium sp.]
MTNHVFLAAAAGAMLLATPAMAATTITHTTHAQSATATNVKSAKATHHRHHQKMTMNMSARGDREVEALNRLESAGYRQFDNLRHKGAGFVATAMKSGKSYDVTITPAGRIDATRA